MALVPCSRGSGAPACHRPVAVVAVLRQEQNDAGAYRRWGCRRCSLLRLGWFTVPCQGGAVVAVLRRKEFESSVKAVRLGSPGAFP